MACSTRPRKRCISCVKVSEPNFGNLAATQAHGYYECLVEELMSPITRLTNRDGFKVEFMDPYGGDHFRGRAPGSHSSVGITTGISRKITFKNLEGTMTPLRGFEPWAAIERGLEEESHIRNCVRDTAFGAADTCAPHLWVSNRLSNGYHDMDKVYFVPVELDARYDVSSTRTRRLLSEAVNKGGLNVPSVEKDELSRLVLSSELY
ncbi:hypothetical protein BT63DRAFT_419306 [Microthyrium microscopicum]|uniref:Uncharacterized protein n=1 Tax=Microthyrium microscopicum TaxID=703497 RepID=A0A6A6TSU1_9PEZI|nr:hypothetical protein BT63DRAFT_419306 [Microthyrium microscopicum]